jgi:hypothetical protein
LSCFALACSLSHLPNLCSAYQAENLYYGLTGERLEQLDKQHIDPLMSAMKARGITLAEKYLMARRAKERNEAVGRLHPATHDFHKAIAKAKSEGKYNGRKPTARAEADDAVQMFRDGRRLAHIAKELENGRGSVYRTLEAAGLTGQTPNDRTAHAN